MSGLPPSSTSLADTMAVQPTWTALLRALASPSLLVLTAYLASILLLASWIVRRSVLPARRTHASATDAASSSSNLLRHEAVEKLGGAAEADEASAAATKAWIVLVGLSFATTWFFMIRYMFWSYGHFLDTASLAGVPVPALPSCRRGCALASTLARLYRLRQWLDATSLFEEAWLLVTTHPLAWWWSFEICMLTVGSWALFLRTESKRIGVPHAWAYMVIGQMVAISVAANLFHVALWLRSPPTGSLLEAQTNRLHWLAEGVGQALPDSGGVEGDDGNSSPRGRDNRSGGSSVGAGQQARRRHKGSNDSGTSVDSALAVTETSTRTVVVEERALLRLPSASPSLTSRATLALLVAAGAWAVAGVPRSLASILVMHVFPLVVVLDCPVRVHGWPRLDAASAAAAAPALALAERLSGRSLRGIASAAKRRAARLALRPSRVHLALAVVGLALKLRTVQLAWHSLDGEALRSDTLRSDAVGGAGLAMGSLGTSPGRYLGGEVAAPAASVSAALRLPYALAAAFVSNAARSSIGSDAVCAALGVAAFVLLDRRRIVAAGLDRQEDDDDGGGGEARRNHPNHRRGTPSFFLSSSSVSFARASAWLAALTWVVGAATTLSAYLYLRESLVERAELRDEARLVRAASAAAAAGRRHDGAGRRHDGAAHVKDGVVVKREEGEEAQEEADPAERDGSSRRGRRDGARGWGERGRDAEQERKDDDDDDGEDEEIAALLVRHTRTVQAVRTRRGATSTRAAVGDAADAVGGGDRLE